MKKVAISGVTIDMRHHDTMPDLKDGVVYDMVDGWCELLMETYPGKIFNITRKKLPGSIRSIYPGSGSLL